MSSPGRVAVLVTLMARAALAQDSTAKPADLAPILKGIYNAEQASRGEATYKGTCSACHATSDYIGEKFDKSWLGRTAFDLFETLRTTMPDDNPGALSRDEYVDVVAYLFKLNGYPAGDSALVADDEKLRLVKIEPRPADKPGTDHRVSRAIIEALRRTADRPASRHLELDPRPHAR
jgi:mono/diheme cytochrome c family protein